MQMGSGVVLLGSAILVFDAAGQIERSLCLPPNMIDSTAWNMRRPILLSKEEARGGELPRRHGAPSAREGEKEKRSGIERGRTSGR